ncbi:39S ribosomal protein L40 mitochondrial [Fasciolopsis buskii]|uniref:Large ribosomal subunit protein mL40 n=1 Tax=Fasciolopsis buskii TaxID=27845 RepID=A0A8E0RXV0_9TREM|nr:39S ribosomal protein L40 mitochondrial [Fasciolopsis buski]
MRRIEKEIKRFTRQDRQLKPISEIEGDRELMKNLQQRTRAPVDLSENELDRRALLLKEWTRNQLHVDRTELRHLKRAIAAQKRALDWLRLTSPDLYQAAIQPCATVLELSDVKDDSVSETLPISGLTGPYRTPPRIHGDRVDCPEDEYDAPDGEWIDSTPTFNYEFELERQFMAEPKKKKMEMHKSTNVPSTSEE